MTTLSVVIPVFNEREEDLSTTLDALSRGLGASRWTDPEIVLVDDGSARPVAQRCVAHGRLRILRQENHGRFEARRAGIEAANGEYVLLLDSRVTLDPSGLAWVHDRVAAGERAWNGHCLMADPDSLYARFWTCCRFGGLFRLPRRPAEDHFGSRSTITSRRARVPLPGAPSLAARGDSEARLPIRGFSGFSSDDAHMLRRIAEQGEEIDIAPEFASLYRNREAMCSVPHARGTPGRHFLRQLRAPRNALLPRRRRLLAAVSRRRRAGHPAPACRPRVHVCGGGRRRAAFGLRRRRPLADALAFGALLTPFAVAFSAGIWRGALMAAHPQGARVIGIVYGTTGELIKLAAVIAELRRRSAGAICALDRASRSLRSRPSNTSWACRRSTCGWRISFRGHDLELKHEIPSCGSGSARLSSWSGARCAAVLRPMPGRRM